MVMMLGYQTDFPSSCTLFLFDSRFNKKKDIEGKKKWKNNETLPVTVSYVGVWFDGGHKNVYTENKRFTSTKS